MNMDRNCLVHSVLIIDKTTRKKDALKSKVQFSHADMSDVHILLVYLTAVSFDFAASEIQIRNSPCR